MPDEAPPNPQPNSTINGPVQYVVVHPGPAAGNHESPLGKLSEILEQVSSLSEKASSWYEKVFRLIEKPAQPANGTNPPPNPLKIPLIFLVIAFLILAMIEGAGIVFRHYDSESQNAQAELNEKAYAQQMKQFDQMLTRAMQAQTDSQRAAEAARDAANQDRQTAEQDRHEAFDQIAAEARSSSQIETELIHQNELIAALNSAKAPQPEREYVSVHEFPYLHRREHKPAPPPTPAPIKPLTVVAPTIEITPCAPKGDVCEEISATKIIKSDKLKQFPDLVDLPVTYKSKDNNKELTLLSRSAILTLGYAAKGMEGPAGMCAAPETEYHEPLDPVNARKDPYTDTLALWLRQPWDTLKWQPWHALEVWNNPLNWKNHDDDLFLTLCTTYRLDNDPLPTLDRTVYRLTRTKPGLKLQKDTVDSKSFQRQ